MNDIDLLMARIETINLKTADDITADDIDTLVSYYRHNRGRVAAGEKPKKPSVDLSGIMANLKVKTAAANPPPEKIKWRKIP